MSEYHSAFLPAKLARDLRIQRSVSDFLLRRKHCAARFEHWKTTYEGRVCNALWMWSKKNGREALAR